MKSARNIDMKTAVNAVENSGIAVKVFAVTPFS